jgi:hypothetical protein
MKCHLLKLCALGAAAVALPGCSTHPLPQDVSGVSTVQIVRNIRCEARDGLEAALRKAAAQGPSQLKQVEKIALVTTIGYDFKFVMAEDSKAAVSDLTFKRASSTPGDGFTLTLLANLNGFQAGPDNHSRQNTRTFRVVDHLADLAKARCGRRKGNEPNLIYPITGSVGMAEVVQTYIELEVFTDLAPEAKTTVGDKAENITFSDRLDFTTTLDAGATATWKFETAAGSLRLTNASLSGSAHREDTHSVTVALARDKDVDPDLSESARAIRAASAAKSREPSFPLELIRDRRVRFKLAQRAAIARNRVFLELERRRLVDEDRDVASRVLGVQLP